MSNPQTSSKFTNGKKQYVCKICGKPFKLKSALIRHERIHSDERPYNCDVCDKNFKEKCYLTRHQLIHSGLKKHQCDFSEICFH